MDSGVDTREELTHSRRVVSFPAAPACPEQAVRFPESNPFQNVKPILIIPTVLAAMASLAPGSTIVQELFDGIAGPPPGSDSTLNGKGDTATSIGMTGTWATNGSTGIFTASNFNVDGSTLPGLPSNAGANGGLWWNGGSWNTDIYATRPLASVISFATSQEIFFSVRLNNGGDTAMGLGLAAGANGSAEFVGAGFHWNGANAIDGSNTANAAYITSGTLDQNLVGNNDGPYAVRAHEAAGSVNGRGLLVGRITINVAGDDVISIKRYAENAVIDNDLTAITWSASANVNSSMDASHLLLWLNGSGNGELDAIRVGTTWTDVTGVTLVPEPSVAGLGLIGLIGLLRRRR